MATWKELIEDAMKDNGDSFSNLVSLELAHNEWSHNKEGKPSLLDKFYDGYGGAEGCYFQLWTTDFVYFPICYDGAEWCGSASRNPNGKALEHQGGG